MSCMISGNSHERCNTRIICREGKELGKCLEVSNGRSLNMAINKRETSLRLMYKLKTICHKNEQGQIGSE